ncbi:hypothetical protein B0H66DRAFT_534083 [Apodospora peruviana]|uniref:Uncharacterized protein n=1 Tax=Apodospora peruviana TaxID=516989 RepID=A0AAE0M1Q5_9PEZI|nr:hypothetical protein B0H66DRAFT_534083 [Apodospora peruviana]
MADHTQEQVSVPRSALCCFEYRFGPPRHGREPPPQPPRDSREYREPRELREPRHHRDVRDSHQRDTREPHHRRDSRDYRTPETVRSERPREFAGSDRRPEPDYIQDLKFLGGTYRVLKKDPMNTAAQRKSTCSHNKRPLSPSSTTTGDSDLGMGMARELDIICLDCCRLHFANSESKSK